ncbi:hypothetical protein BD410DRAFT_892800 [Rickenella mellea]|uniref:RING-type domain-containing protein n=1 Tax=Rickenella mellea TaxID=50990 RepID=A0A4R5XH20_9AGAM|nr:hypothetical protein BD410DRAFT_892800 [Rickenella mellea]
MPPLEMRTADSLKADAFLENAILLRRSQVPEDESCPICLTSFTSILKEQEDAQNVEQELPLEEPRYFGVMKLEGCGHIFCAQDISEWIHTGHGSCPSCRRTFLDIRPYSESDYESSDGGEYIPGENDEDDDMDLPTSELDADHDDFDADEDWHDVESDGDENAEFDDENEEEAEGGGLTSLQLDMLHAPGSMAADIIAELDRPWDDGDNAEGSISDHNSSVGALTDGDTLSEGDASGLVEASQDETFDMYEGDISMQIFDDDSGDADDDETKWSAEDDVDFEY